MVIIDQVNIQLFEKFMMLKLYSFFFRKIIFKFYSIIPWLLLNKLLSSYHAADLAIWTIKSFNCNRDLFITFFNCNVSIFKSQTSREIFIENCNFANSIITIESINRFLDKFSISISSYTINWFTMILWRLWCFCWII